MSDYGHLVASNVFREIRFGDRGYFLARVCPCGLEPVERGNRLEVVLEILLPRDSYWELRSVVLHWRDGVECNEVGPIVKISTTHPADNYKDDHRFTRLELTVVGETWEEAYEQAHRYLGRLVGYASTTLRERDRRLESRGKELYLSWEAIQAIGGSGYDSATPLGPEEQRALIDFAGACGDVRD